MSMPLRDGVGADDLPVGAAGEDFPFQARAVELTTGNVDDATLARRLRRCAEELRLVNGDGSAVEEFEFGLGRLEGH